MNIVERLRDMQKMSLYIDGNFNVTYKYDGSNRIVEEKVTGAVNRVTTYEYDAQDNVTKEIYNDGLKIITKVFTYDVVSGNLTSIQGSTAKI